MIGRPLQPYKGSSETAFASSRVTGYGSLQSHKGSSETSRCPSRPSPGWSFNPTWVRLKPMPIIWL
nr:hypothetical protein [Halovivax sp. KZCA124]